MTQITMPSYTNDTGTGTDGTIIDSTFFDSIGTGVNDLVHSTTNPTVTPINIIDEVVAARGTKADLETFLDVEHNHDGTHNLGAGVAQTSQIQQSMQGVNLISDSTFIIWAAGDSAAPSHWTLSGAGAAVARTGVGLADTTRKVGKYAAKLTYGSATAILTQTIFDSGVWSNVDFLEGTIISASCWVFSSTVNKANIAINDGATSTNSSVHTGGGGWEQLTVSHTVDGAATSLSLKLRMTGTGNAVFSGPTVVMNDLAPTRWIPSPCVLGVIGFKNVGAISVGDMKDVFLPARPTKLLDVQTYVKTASSSGNWTFQIEVGDGTTWNDANGGVFTVDVNDEFHNSTFGGTYQYTCLTGLHLDNGDNGDATNAMLQLNIDSIGTGTSDVWWFIRALQFTNPLEPERAYNDFG